VAAAADIVVRCLSSSPIPSVHVPLQRLRLLLVCLTAAECDEDVAKTPAAENVNDEVNRRVGDDEQVAYSREEEIRVRAALIGQGKGSYESLGDERWTLGTTMEGRL